jgi:ADP-dependent phosphofructokinase/glucokinase
VASNEATKPNKIFIKQKNKINIGFTFEFSKGINFKKIFIPTAIRPTFETTKSNLYVLFIII